MSVWMRTYLAKRLNGFVSFFSLIESNGMFCASGVQDFAPGAAGSSPAKIETVPTAGREETLKLEIISGSGSAIM